ncbi:NADH-quinone oxidoreductase subunit L [Candidatus Portiera aleyrodidarum]|uniref:NADH dehydrogenase n=1 Tax=Candidatus Portiera aleyrodidarum MED (Bemisia tabaci) TaxID=1163752 RepID=A0AAU8RR40_9GAMM|nr:NADH-quinone oxidoreductase subunit L [Candidatus Portiera aleyrodidarum]AFQ23979.1 NADH dehydrogenase subunit L [Candidatus Portiera aleyrodidarum BT-B-HRs]AFS18744.1 NADH-ubiquinone oxidoreductase chain L [Candidatus Portiera aleyrodidarum BT-QVLC]AFT80371.1 ADH-ubiquinone oxidoreductase chain L [Candidatus Portiera aleyrodidarum BT-QVLC]AFT80651.1 ADH-ubiquinone oxidoreductase chain L [Candidatus Portiera aleyrodidarum BT-B-HRs]AJF23958.1 NADH dehydrogenase [Candidatus Portiera aleyrodid
MKKILILICLFPLISTLLLASLRCMSKILVCIIGVGSIVSSTIFAILLAFYYYLKPNPFLEHLYSWISIYDVKINFNFYIDGLSVVMICIVNGIGLLIHLFSTWYMCENFKYKKDYLLSRFFLYMNLFMLNMLILILGDNLILLLLGWEGVGFCSYLLISYYYRVYNNVISGFKAFITTRIGDLFFAIGIFFVWIQFNTFDIQQLLTKFSLLNNTNSFRYELIAFMFMLGTISKSAQIPLHTWLIDAMVGPTPVSALIHAATMITSGVYFIIRTHFLFELAPITLNTIGLIGTITLLLAGISALTQNNIKRILACSTLSQVGYMFVAIGIKAWHAAIFHVMIHAFFKALLFISAGSLIISCKHSQNILKIRSIFLSLSKNIRIAYYFCFVIGGSALSALPIITAGFYSKEKIILLSKISGYNKIWIVGLVGAFITSIYTFRTILIMFNKNINKFIIFFNNQKPLIYNVSHNLPLFILLILSTYLGSLIKIPMQKEITMYNIEVENCCNIISSIIVIVGITIAAKIFLFSNVYYMDIIEVVLGKLVLNIIYTIGGFDWLYIKLVIIPYLYLVRINKFDCITFIINNIINKVILFFYTVMTKLHNGNLSFYLTIFIVGIITSLLMSNIL